MLCKAYPTPVPTLILHAKCQDGMLQLHCPTLHCEQAIRPADLAEYLARWFLEALEQQEGGDESPCCRSCRHADEWHQNGERFSDCRLQTREFDLKKTDPQRYQDRWVFLDEWPVDDDGPHRSGRIALICPHFEDRD